MTHNDTNAGSCDNAVWDLAVWMTDHLGDEVLAEALSLHAINVRAGERFASEQTLALYEEFIGKDPLLGEKLACLANDGNRHRPSSRVRSMQLSGMRDALTIALRAYKEFAFMADTTARIAEYRKQQDAEPCLVDRGELAGISA